jgi:GNAT superfamily N-acetyltransferase
MTASACVVRPLTSADRAGWQPLWEAYLDFYESPEVGAGADALFARLIARADGLAGFVAEQDGGLVGLAHGVLHASTWHAGPACYLEDLFVASGVRGGGTGRALIDAITAWGVDAGAERVYWITQTGNDQARALYDTLARVEPFVLYERPLGSGGV